MIRDLTTASSRGSRRKGLYSGAKRERDECGLSGLWSISRESAATT